MFQHIDFDIYMFYLMELSFYWSLLFAMLFQKDYQKKVGTLMLDNMNSLILKYGYNGPAVKARQQYIWEG